MQLTSVTNPNSETNTAKPRLHANQPSAISLMCLFQVLTACCIFFACHRVSPLLAIVGTIFSTPAIIRTGLVSDLYRRNGLSFGWGRRLLTFAHSLWIVLITACVSFIVFSFISLACGLGCVAIAVLCGSRDMTSDIVVVGTLGGMVWGGVGGMVTMGYCAKFWKPADPVAAS